VLPEMTKPYCYLTANRLSLILSHQSKGLLRSEVKSVLWLWEIHFRPGSRIAFSFACSSWKWSSCLRRLRVYSWLK
jgi:hypothetical protein